MMDKSENINTVKFTPKRRQYRSYLRSLTAQAPRSTRQRHEKHSAGADGLSSSPGCSHKARLAGAARIIGPSHENTENQPDFHIASSSGLTGMDIEQADETFTDGTFPAKDFTAQVSTSNSDLDDQEIDDVDEQPSYILEEETSSTNAEDHKMMELDQNDDPPQRNEDTKGPPLKIPNLEKPLSKLTLTAFEVLLMILNYSFRHGLTAVATEDLCKLVNMVLEEEAIPTSQYMFKKIFRGDIPYQFHFYCSGCDSYIGQKTDFEKDKSIIFCAVCEKECNLTKMNDGNFFITIPLKDQLIMLLENTDDILNLLEYRWKPPSDDIRDIYDGEVYKNLTEPGNFLSNHHNLSVTFNTDGAAVFDSAKNTMWPIQFRINELPPSHRFKQNNCLIAGVCFGKKDPNMTTFLSTFIKEANDLYNFEFKWTAPNGAVIESKVTTLNCVVDSKAKPLLQSVKQFNGYFGCGYCLHPGVVLEDGSNQAKYSVDNGDLTLLNDLSFAYTASRKGSLNREQRTFEVKDRDNQSMRNDMKTVERERLSNPRLTDLRGVKGFSPLVAIENFDVVFGFSIDWMHAICIGIVKMMAGLWLDSTSKDHPYYIGKKINEVDKRLLLIKPPTSISRRPRPIADRVHWKANEWRSWLLYFSLPCLKGILPITYLKHYSILVSAIYLLLKDAITPTELDEAAWYLGIFVVEFQDLYTERYMYYNVHLALHLAKCVKLWGPLWCYSTFSFESGNGTLIKLVKGTRGVTTQIAQKYCMFLFIPKAIRLYETKQKVLNYCTDLLCYRLVPSSSNFGSITLLGTEKIVKLSADLEETFWEAKIPVTNLSYERMVVNGIMYHAQCYTRKGDRSNDTLVRLSNNSYAVLERIITSENVVYVLVRILNIEKDERIINHGCGATASHIEVCSPIVYGSFKIINADSITSKAIFLPNFNDKTYVTNFPNFFEKD